MHSCCILGERTAAQHWAQQTPSRKQLFTCAVHQLLCNCAQLAIAKTPFFDMDQFQITFLELHEEVLVQNDDQFSEKHCVQICRAKAVHSCKGCTPVFQGCEKPKMGLLLHPLVVNFFKFCEVSSTVSALLPCVTNQHATGRSRQLHSFQSNPVRAFRQQATGWSLADSFVLHLFSTLVEQSAWAVAGAPNQGKTPPGEHLSLWKSQR